MWKCHDERNREIVQRYDAGETRREISEAMRLSLGAVRAVVRRARGVDPSRAAKHERNEEFLKLFREGVSFPAIARKFNTTKGAVAGAVDRARKRGADVPPAMPYSELGHLRWKRARKRCAPTDTLSSLLAQADALIAG